MSLPGTRVIHPDMLARLRPVASGSLVDECTISRPSTAEPTWNAGLGRSVPAAPTAVFTGVCRVQPRPTDDRVVSAGEEPVTLRSYYVELPWDTDEVLVDDLITITASADADLAGRVLRVADIAYTSLHVVRHLICEDNLG